MVGPPISSMATFPAYAYISAYEIFGFRSLIGSKAATILSNPALPPCASSSLNRIVPPDEPPVCVILSYVPDECHANRTKVGPKFASFSIKAFTSFLNCLKSFSESAALLREDSPLDARANGGADPCTTVLIPTIPTMPTSARNTSLFVNER